MNLLDIFLFLVLLAFIYKGTQQGIAYMVGQAIGIIIGVLIASRIFDDLARLLQPLFLGNFQVAAVFSFVVIFQVINELLGLLLRSLNILSSIKSFPLINSFETIDRWVGALLGLFVGNLILGVILYFLVHTPIYPTFDELLLTSNLTPLFIRFASWFTILFPPEFQELPSLITQL